MPAGVRKSVLTLHWDKCLIWNYTCTVTLGVGSMTMQEIPPES